ncbi:GNAT family N-acetyltransferase [Microbulbifer halophilus]|uniref:GNAT family N-acetyltransferase n=1 Tax=Microbulbifer halophilus TaxID=453963 RepID=A0ABW5ED18_9GAMM|nr:GNAT family N-acetyltransferase [Microbulbifer halophilus]MCW8127226.1 GNAT family N-acetyltransferase [Microbulbifer halophilus]
MTVEIRAADWQRDRDAIRSVRDAVFIREQGVDPAIEWDASDDTAQHFLVLRDGRPVGTGRLATSGKIGRMAVLQSERDSGLGQRLLAHICSHAREQGFDRVTLHAQRHAEGFYRRAGFAAEGEPFVEADIDHIRMVQDFG